MGKETGKMYPNDDTPNRIPSLTAIRLKWGFRRFLYVAGVLLRSKHGPLYIGGLVAAFALLTMSAQSIYAAWNPAPVALSPLTLPGEPRPATALHIPMPVLEKTLNLTSGEKSKIKMIHDAFHRAERGILPSPRSGEVDPAMRQMAHAKVAELEKQSAAQMEAALTSAQAVQVPALLTNAQNLEQVGIPAAAYADLNLSAEQKQRLAAVADTARTDMSEAVTDAGQNGGLTALRDNLERIQYATHKDALAILTAAQRQTVAAHPPHKPHPPRPPDGPRPPHGPPPPGDPEATAPPTE